MTLETFARDHRLRLKRPSRDYQSGPHSDRPFIPGKRGWIMASDQGNEWSVFLIAKSTGHIVTALREGRKLGMTPQGRGDTELKFWFDPGNQKQVGFALKTILGRKKRRVVVTPEMRTRLAAIGFPRRMPVLEQRDTVQSIYTDLAALP